MTKAIITSLALLAACQTSVSHHGASSPKASHSAKAPPKVSPSSTPPHRPSPKAAKPHLTAWQRRMRAPVTVASVPVSGRFVLDGHLGDWNIHREPPSHRMVSIAVNATQLIIASSVDNVSLALATAVPRMPEIGWLYRGGFTAGATLEGCDHEFKVVSDGAIVKGKKHPPEVIQLCRALIQRRAAHVLKQDERFVRRFRLTPHGVSAVDASGATSPIDGARFAAGADGGIEVQLPLSALPQLAQSPLSSWKVAAAVGSLPSGLLPPTEANKKGWTDLKLATPISFGRHRSCLDMLFGEYGFSPVEGEATGPTMAQLSYHPGKPDYVETIVAPDNRSGSSGGLDRPALVTHKHALYTPLDKLGGIELGVVGGPWRVLVTQKDGVVIQSTPLGQESVQVRGSRRRDKELHVYTYNPTELTIGTGQYRNPFWRVISVDAFGGIKDLVGYHTNSHAVGDVDSPRPYWSRKPKPFNDGSFNRIGVRGLGVERRPQMESWTYNSKTRTYDNSVVGVQRPRVE